MKRTTSQEFVEHAEEALLRATLTMHAPKTVDLEEGWQAIVPHITTLDGRTSSAARLDTFTAKGFPKGQRWGRWPIFASIAALMFIILGTMTGGSLFHWLSNTNDTAYAFSDVLQSQQAQGITITVTKGYAASGRLYIEYTVQLPPILAKHYRHVLVSGSVKNRYMQVKTMPAVDRNGHSIGEQEMELWICNEAWRGSGPTPCLNIVGGYIFYNVRTGFESIGDNGVVKFNVPSMVNTLTFSWDVKEIYLSGPAYGRGITISGDWHFQFTLPYHRQSHDPVLPFSSHMIVGGGLRVEKASK